MILPSARARTVLATSSHVELGVLGQREVISAHLVDPRGGILLRPGRARAGIASTPGMPAPNSTSSRPMSPPFPNRIGSGPGCACAAA